MAIPFYENEEQLQQQQQHHAAEEVDQVDGQVFYTPNQVFSSAHYNNESNIEIHTEAEEDLMVWKILALAMCKALKAHYQQNMMNSTSATTTASTTNTSTPKAESSTAAVIQILSNGQVKPQWN